MRVYTDIAKNDAEILNNFTLLVNKESSPDVYSRALFNLGKKLAGVINDKINASEKVVFSCTTEDADWLGKGIIDHLAPKKNINLAVFWNFRAQPFENINLTVAPIIRSYIENIKDCDTLIICKSIIYTSCVVRTNLTYLIDQMKPSKIIIAAPVIFNRAQDFLSNEFEDSISNKFEYIYFAVDDQVTSDGEVIPGIGGNIYNRLGFKSADEKNRFVPELVKERREQNY